jgi:peroxiredoxin family protein
VSDRSVFFVSSGGYEAAWQSTSLAITAAALGDEVIFVFAFEALRALARGAFGESLRGHDAEAASRAAAINAPVPQKMLADARSLGARVLACDTTVKLSGLEPEVLEREKVVDEVLGLPQLWRLVQGARIFTF